MKKYKNNAYNDYFRLGLIGYCTENFDHKIAKLNLEDAFDDIFKEYGTNVILVSGYTNVGILKLGYDLSKKYGWLTEGFTSFEALSGKYELYPVDIETLIGDKFGDESEAFIESLDFLLKVGRWKAIW